MRWSALVRLKKLQRPLYPSLTTKINLLIFLTPHIVRDDTEIANRSVEERDRFRDFLQKHNVPPQWQEQLDRPSFELPPDTESGGVLLPTVEDNLLPLP